MLTTSAERFQEIFQYATKDIVPDPPSPLEPDQRYQYECQWGDAARLDMSFRFETTEELVHLLLNVRSVFGRAPSVWENESDEE